MMTVFRTPILLKKELANFLKVPYGTMMSSLDTTRMIRNYIINNKLLCSEYMVVPDNRMCIYLDLEHDKIISLTTLIKYICKSYIFINLNINLSK